MIINLIFSLFKPYFKIANSNFALKFELDIEPENCHTKNNSKLPMGCHAWLRNEKIFHEENHKFWSKFIKQI